MGLFVSKRVVFTALALILASGGLLFSFRVRPLEKTEVDLIKAILLTASAYIAAETHRKS